MPNKDLVRQRMINLAEFLEYEYRDINWLERAMYCKITGRKGAVRTEITAPMESWLLSVMQC